MISRFYIAINLQRAPTKWSEKYFKRINKRNIFLDLPKESKYLVLIYFFLLSIFSAIRVAAIRLRS